MEKVQNSTVENQVTELELNEGQVALASIRQSKTPSKVIIEFGDAIKNEANGLNVVALLNASDARFDAKASIRRHYQAAEKADLAALGVPVAAIEETEKTGKTVALKMIDPTITDASGVKHPLCIQLEDSLVPNEYQAANPLKTAKQYTNKNGQTFYFIKDGKFIYGSTRLVTKASRKHNIIKSDVQITAAEAEALLATSVADNAIEALNG
jgi:hypothetical protein